MRSTLGTIPPAALSTPWSRNITTGSTTMSRMIAPIHSSAMRRPPLGDDRSLGGDSRHRAEDRVELGVDRRHRRLERAQMLGLDRLKRAGESRKLAGDRLQAGADPDERGGEHRDDHERQDDAENNEPGHFPPY